MFRTKRAEVTGQIVQTVSYCAFVTRYYNGEEKAFSREDK
jgi:hypothetical protein